MKCILVLAANSTKQLCEVFSFLLCLEVVLRCVLANGNLTIMFCRTCEGQLTKAYGHCLKDVLAERSIVNTM